jgi:MoaA/NifB/PqqE/SkfB family radical SAM enzyme
MPIERPTATQLPNPRRPLPPSLARRIRQRLPSAFDVAKVGFRLFGLPRNAFGSIDVTQKCNLRCKHCYFFEHDQPERALSVDAWVALLEDWKRTRSRWEFPFFQCSWVGGEPLLRPEVIERCRKYFRYNLVVTNGTLPLPDWPAVDFYVSVDGDEEVHEDLRQRKGIYRQIKNNVLARGPGRVTVSYCITRHNAHCIERVVEEWAPLASGFTFDFYTPMEGKNDPLWIAWQERDAIIDRLLALRRAYPDGLKVTEPALRLMVSDRATTVTQNCLFAKKAFAYTAAGQPKEKCMMGAKADCSRCGCIVPFYLHALTHRTPGQRMDPHKRKAL